MDFIFTIQPNNAFDEYIDEDLLNSDTESVSSTEELVISPFVSKLAGGSTISSTCTISGVGVTGSAMRPGPVGTGAGPSRDRSKRQR